MQMVVPADLLERAAPLIGTPWVAKGTTPAGWDCVGLAVWCLGHWCGVPVPTYADHYEASLLASPHRRSEMATTLAANLSDWRSVSPQAGAVAQLRWMGRVAHVGFMLSPTLILHCDRSCGTALLDLDAPSSPYKLAGASIPASVSHIAMA